MHLAGEVLGFRQQGLAVPNRDRLARHHRAFLGHDVHRLPTASMESLTPHKLGLELGVAAQHPAARITAGIAVFVVEPHAPAVLVQPQHSLAQALELAGVVKPSRVIAGFPPDVMRAGFDAGIDNCAASVAVGKPLRNCGVLEGMRMNHGERAEFRRGIAESVSQAHSRGFRGQTTPPS